MLTLFQLALLLPETLAAPVPLNDEAFHLSAVAAARKAFCTDPLTAWDVWLPYWSLGYPLWHAYQPLPHLATGLLAAPFAERSLPALYHLVRLLLLLAWPWSVWVGARWLGLEKGAALAAALLAPFVASPALYGFEWGSYLWRGAGLFSQLWAMVLLPLALGRGARALGGRAGALGAGALLAAVALCHVLFAWVAVAALGLIALVSRRDVPWRDLLRRGAWIAAASVALSAWFFVPMLLDRAAIHLSRWEPAWKWDSFGAEVVLGHLFAGRLFDAGRWPILTVLAAGGLLLGMRRGAGRAERLAALAFLVFLALFCGRPTWGALLPFLGLPAGFHLHRFAGAVQLFGLLLGGVALAAATRWLGARRFPGSRWAAPLLGLALLVPLVGERAAFVREGERWWRESERAITAERADLEALRTALEERVAARPGRVYAGLAAQWGGNFRVGSVPLYAFLSRWQLDAVGFLYHAMTAAGDQMVLFDERRPDHYALFDVGYVVAEVGRALPTFLSPVERLGRFVLYETPARGRFSVNRAAVAVPGAPPATTHEGFAAWLQSDLPVWGLRAVTTDERDPSALPRWRSGEPLPAVDRAALAGAGVVRREERRGPGRWIAEVELAGDGLVTLAESFHPGWRAAVDGAPAPTLQVSPGFVAVPVEAGQHRVELVYRAGSLKPILFIAGCLAFVGMAAWRRRAAGPCGGELPFTAPDRPSGRARRAGHPARAARRPAARPGR